jgi:hypothetical protein
VRELMPTLEPPFNFDWLITCMSSTALLKPSSQAHRAMKGYSGRHGACQENLRMNLHRRSLVHSGTSQEQRKIQTTCARESLCGTNQSHFLLLPLYMKTRYKDTILVHAAGPGRRELLSRRSLTRTASTHIVGSRAGLGLKVIES